MNPSCNIPGTDLENRGCLPVKDDRRDFSFFKTFGHIEQHTGSALTPKDLPNEYMDLVDPKLLGGNAAGNQDQDGTDLCTAEAATDVATDEDGVAYSEDYQFALTKLIMASPISDYGADPRKAMLVPVVKGLLKKPDAPFTWSQNGRDFIADIKNWPPELMFKASQNKKAALYTIDGPYDAFDNLRIALWMFRQQKRSAGIATPWYLEFNAAATANKGLIPDIYTAMTSFHMWGGKGWKMIPGEMEPRLVSKQWDGQSLGDNGFVYFTRKTFNAMMAVKGSFNGMLAPITADTVLAHQLQNSTTLGIILELLARLRFLLPIKT